MQLSMYGVRRLYPIELLERFLMESVQIFARFMVSCASFDFRSLERQQFLVASQSLKGSLKGGDPAAPSGTAALLRLNPSYQFYLGRLPPCG